MSDATPSPRRQRPEATRIASAAAWKNAAVHTVRVLTGTSTLHLVALCGTLGVAIGVAIFVAQLDNIRTPDGRHLGGDFLVFYTAGQMVAEGRGGDLYNYEAQAAAQAEIVSDPDWQALAAYVNPPGVAIACAVLGVLPYRWAYLAGAITLFAVFCLGWWLLRPLLPRLVGRSGFWIPVAVSALWFPYLRTITGGQNTALTFTLLAAVFVMLRSHQPALAGIALGLLSYKPQMAVVVGLLLLWRREYSCVLISGGVAVAHYLAGAAICGWGWPIEMIEMLRLFWPLEYQYNGANLISWLGVSEWVLPRAVFPVVGWGLCAITGAVVVWLWWGVNPRKPEAALPFAAAICATVLLSPHTQWYDAGLILLPVLILLERRLRRDQEISAAFRALLLAGFLLFPIYPLVSVIGVQPLLLWPVLTLLAVVREWREARTADVPIEAPTVVRA